MANPGKEFEQRMAPSLDAYAEAGVAFLAFMPVPMAPCGQRSKWGGQLFTPKGKAPFDIYGYYAKDGRFIGCELKATSRHSPSLSIVMPNGSGDGLQFHQLDALANVVNNGGFAFVVWENAGDVGVLTGDFIKVAHAAAMASMESSRTPARGARSIKWELFKRANYQAIGGKIIPDWLGYT